MVIMIKENLSFLFKSPMARKEGTSRAGWVRTQNLGIPGEALDHYATWPVVIMFYIDDDHNGLLQSHIITHRQRTTAHVEGQ